MASLIHFWLVLKDEELVVSAMTLYPIHVPCVKGSISIDQILDAGI